MNSAQRTKYIMHGCVSWQPFEFQHRARWFGRGAVTLSAQVCLCGCSALRVWKTTDHNGAWTLNHGLSDAAAKRALERGRQVATRCRCGTTHAR